MKHLVFSYSFLSPGDKDLPQEIQSMKKLQSFSLHFNRVNLPNWICEFQQLERLELFYCFEVEGLPSLERLPNLKFLKLEDCETVKDLGIGSSGGFPMLEILVLNLMEQLQSLTGPSWEGGVLKEGTLGKLRVIKIRSCPALKKLPMGIEKLPSLTALYGGVRWWENIIGEDNNIKIYLHNVFKAKGSYMIDSGM
jgi:hypothetical protein